jgi:hypothetical protein
VTGPGTSAPAFAALASARDSAVTAANSEAVARRGAAGGRTEMMAREGMAVLWR